MNLSSGSCEQKLESFFKEHNIVAKHLQFEDSVHSVKEACAQTGANPDDFVKTICMITPDQKLVGAIVLGSDTASSKRVAKALSISRPRLATPLEANEKTGFLVGGIPPFGFDATFVVDPAVMDKDRVFAGGGTPHALVQLSPKEILRINSAVVVRIRK